MIRFDTSHVKGSVARQSKHPNGEDLRIDNNANRSEGRVPEPGWGRQGKQTALVGRPTQGEEVSYDLLQVMPEVPG